MADTDEKTAPAPRHADFVAMLHALRDIDRPRDAFDVVKDACIVILILCGLAIAVGLGAGSIRWGFGL